MMEAALNESSYHQEKHKFFMEQTLSRTEKAILCAGLVLIATLGICGNIFVMIVIAVSKKIDIRRHAFTFNLCLADLCMTLLSTLMMIVSLHYEGWVFGQGACVAFAALYTQSIVCSVYSMGLIALCRYFSIVKTHLFAQNFTKKKIFIMIIAAWIVAFIVVCPPIFGWGHMRYEPRSYFCIQDWKASVSYTLYGILPTSIAINVVMIFCYSGIYKTVRDSKLAVKNHQSVDVTCLFCKTDVKLTMQLFVVYIVFTILMTPYTALSVIFETYTYLPKRVYLTAAILPNINASLNPFVYFFMNADYRQELVKLTNRCLRTKTSWSNGNSISMPSEVNDEAEPLRTRKPAQNSNGWQKEENNLCQAAIRDICETTVAIRRDEPSLEASEDALEA